MWPDRRIVDMLGIEHPLVLAPMAGFCTVELAAAVCEAGGLGSIACATMPPEAALQAIGDLRRRTKSSVNVNFFCHRPAKAERRASQAWHEPASPLSRRAWPRSTSSPRRLELAPFGEGQCPGSSRAPGPKW